MKQLSLLIVFGIVALVPALPQKADSFAGRWDITVSTSDSTYPDWMELVEKDSGPEVRVQPRGGSVHPATNVKEDGSHLTLTFTPGTANRPEVTWDLTANGDRFTGDQKRGGEVVAHLAGVRAPAMHRSPPTAWTTPEPIFNGKDLTGWEPTNAAATNQW